MNIVGKNLKKFREASGLSQKELAQHMSVTRQTISNWERGISQPDLDSLLLLAGSFQVDVTDIIYDKRPQNEFELTRPKRVKHTCILGITFVFVLLIYTIFMPWFSSHSIYNVSLYFTINNVFLPAVYIIGTVFVLSILSIWMDFRISNIKLNLIIMLSSWIFIFLYISYMFTSSLGQFWGFYLNDLFHTNAIYHFFIDHSEIFIFPGAMLFLGFNRKPKVSDESP